LYRTRQEINEHIFGTIKRQWGYNHTNRVGKVNGEHSNYVGLQHQTRYKHTHGTGLIAKIKEMEVTIQSKTYFAIIMTYFSLSRENNKTGLQFAA
jgi:hypothetical protein